MSQKERKSLQFQYVFFSGVLMVLIVAAILFSRTVATEKYQFLASQRDEAALVLNLSTELRDHIATISKSIDIVMLEPEYKNQISLVFKASFNEINSILKRIKSQPLIVGVSENILLDVLAKNMTKLNQYSHQLFEIRTNIFKQYPSLAVSEYEIFPAREAINNIFSVSLNEAENEALSQSNSSAYELLIKGRRLWGDVISTYRLYLANKLGAINDSELDFQENNVDQMIENMFGLEDKFQLRLVNDEYPFEATEALKTLRLELINWKKGFTKVKEIHHSDVWRADASFMRNTILPLVNEINDSLKAFDGFIHKKNKGFVKDLAKVSEQQSFYLVLMAFIFVVYSLSVFIFLNRLIFKPLKMFTNNLRSKVFSLDEKELMGLAHTQETFVLIDAFIKMHHQSIARSNELSYQAMHDSLTGLPNRKSLMISLDQNIKLANRQNKSMSFLMLDLNRFKEVNDTLGHHIGDELLIKVGERINLLLREVDLVARLGGDEFSIVLPETNRKEGALVAIKINQALKKNFSVMEYSLNVGVSIGIAEYPSDGKNANSLMQHADVAMYDCKRNNADFSFYDLEKDSHSLASLELSQDLKRAIKEKTLMLYYQPKLSVESLKPVGSEALLRWTHPKAGFITPEHIIEVAEGSGLIDDLTLFIIERALSDHELLQKQGHQLKIAINLSVHNLKSEVFVLQVAKIIKILGVDARCITFEITESAMMSDPERSINMMKDLTQLGIKFSVDDFGTGFSSLAYLKKLPVSELKIDRSFVNDIVKDPSDKVIVKSTIELAHNLGLSVVAEGIEDEESLMLIKQMGCDETQGYYFSKPLPFNQFVTWLSKHS